MKKQSIFTLFLLSATLLWAQVPRNIVVEHFTNTRCSACASRNPGFITNVNAQSNVFHMAIHPSAPYSSCLLNQHNKVENDARTRYYNIFGSTPRVVVQGTPLSTSANYSSSAIFDPYKNQTSPLLLTTILIEELTGTIKLQVVVKAVANHSLSNLLINASALEENLNYAAPNGENMHHNVFRKSFFTSSGQVFIVPQNVGDSIIFTGSITKNSEWTTNQIYALVFVQNASTREILQASRSQNLGTPTSIKKIDPKIGDVYPNPIQSQLNIQLAEQLETWISITDITGKTIYHQSTIGDTKVDLSAHPSGIYFIAISNNKGSNTYKVMKLN